MTADKTPLRIILWVAVSSSPQAGEDKNSLPNQEQTLRQWAERVNGQVIDVLTVPGFSRRYLTWQEFQERARDEQINAPGQMAIHWERRDFDVVAFRDGSRFGRTQSLFSYFVERTVLDCDARLFSLQDGWITGENHRLYTAMGGYSASSEIDALVKKRRAAMDVLSSRGLPTSNAPSMAHRVEYDPVTRKALRQVLDESKSQLWQYLYELVVNERIAWANLERELYNRYAIINPNTGKWYARHTFYGVIYQPAFWGHTGRYYDHLDAGKSWVYDDTEAPPAGVMLFRHTIPPVFTGEQAERLKDELRRREALSHGKTPTNVNYAFTGLLMCDVCRTLLMVKPTRHGERLYVYFRCSDKTSSFQEFKCTQPNVHNSTVVDFLTPYISELISTGDMSLLYPKQQRRDDRPDLMARIARLQEQINDDIQSQRASRVQSVKDRYREEIDRAAEQLEILEAQLAALDKEASPNYGRALVALDELGKMTLPVFWQQTPGYQNQVLHAIFGRQRLLTRDGRIVGIDTYVKRGGNGSRYKRASS